MTLERKIVKTDFKKLFEKKKVIPILITVHII